MTRLETMSPSGYQHNTSHTTNTQKDSNVLKAQRTRH